jgi:hemerythrin
MAITWTPQLAVGVPEIDAQHQELFRRVDSLLESIQFGRAQDEVARLLEYVGDYVHLHFGAEESLMQQHGYPQRAAHFAEHREFVRSFVELKRELERRGPTPEFAAVVGSALVDWLREHIGATDWALGAWMAAQAGGARRRE